jgi:hypothetical protein
VTGRFLSITLALLFFAFCEESENVVPFDQFSTGFSILGGGSKSDKLSAGFRLFDDDEDGCLNRKQVRYYKRGPARVSASLPLPFCPPPQAPCTYGAG